MDVFRPLLYGAFVGSCITVWVVSLAFYYHLICHAPPMARGFALVSFAALLFILAVKAAITKLL